MPALEFNVRGSGQHMTIKNSPIHLHPEKGFTIEALLTPLGVSEDPTVFCRARGTRWEPPFIAYRLGFQGKTLIPEFQILFDGEPNAVTVRAVKSVPLGHLTHLGGTYDGEHIRLFVNGELVGEVKNIGTTVRSSEPPTIASRSATDPGGYYVGLLHEIRAWNIARTQEEINRWKFRVLPLPAPSECQGLWQTERGITRENAIQLQTSGFSERERAWVAFIGRYVSEYNRLAPRILGQKTKSHFGELIRSCVLIKGMDGYVAIYEPTFPTYVKTTLPGVESPLTEGVFLYHEPQHTISEILQSRTRNAIKVRYPTVGNRLEEPWVEPEDLHSATAGMFAPKFRSTDAKLPKISITPKPVIRNGVVKGVQSGRFRIVAPLIIEEQDQVSRLLSSLFIDLWFGEISWDITDSQLAEALTISDLVALDLMVTAPLLPGIPASVRPTDPTDAVEAIVREFENLLDTPSVEEVKDIQPFLAEPKRWFLLSPSCKYIWPQKC